MNRVITSLVNGRGVSRLNTTDCFDFNYHQRFLRFATTIIWLVTITTRNFEIINICWERKLPANIYYCEINVAKHSK